MRPRRSLTAALAGATLGIHVACSEPGPAEKAGKAIDDAVDNEVATAALSPRTKRRDPG